MVYIDRQAKIKHSILVLFCFASVAFAEEEPLLPVLINAFLPKIKVGMTSEEIKAVVAKSYAKAESRVGPWSGGTGSLGCRLDNWFSFAIAAHTNSEGKQVVSKDARIYIYDWQHKRRLEIVIYQWEGDGKAASPVKKPGIYQVVSGNRR